MRITTPKAKRITPAYRPEDYPPYYDAIIQGVRKIQHTKIISDGTEYALDSNRGFPSVVHERAYNAARRAYCKAHEDLMVEAVYLVCTDPRLYRLFVRRMANRKLVVRRLNQILGHIADSDQG